MNFLNSVVILIAAVFSYSFYSGFWLRFDFAINFLKTIIIIIIIIIITIIIIILLQVVLLKEN